MYSTKEKISHFSSGTNRPSANALLVDNTTILLVQKLDLKFECLITHVQGLTKVWVAQFVT